jgi:hypothetical protein
MTKEKLSQLIELNNKIKCLEKIVGLINSNYPIDFGYKKSTEGEFSYVEIIGCDDLIKNIIIEEYNNILKELESL